MSLTYDTPDQEQASTSDYDACIEDVLKLHLPISALNDMSTAISQITARAWARVTTDDLDYVPDHISYDTVDQIVLAAMRRQYGLPNHYLVEGLRNLPYLISQYGPGQIQQIASLMEVFSRYTKSTPEGMQSADWKSDLRQHAAILSTEAQALYDNDNRSVEKIQISIDFLIENFTNLWS